MNKVHIIFLSLSGVFVSISLCISYYLISKHQKYMSQLHIQPKIVGILWMVPIYSVCSFISLWNPPYALFVDMLRDCYEAYVLYLFLALMLSYLDADEDEYPLVQFLEKSSNVTKHLPTPLSYCCPQELPRGKDFLRYCKFGTMQYCVVRPLATLVALMLDAFDLYHESNFSPRYGYLYITLLVNVSVGYAFVVLASFYSSLKYRLKPYEPVGKFLCIKFIIFFAFWQGVIIAALVRAGAIRSIDDYYSAERLSIGLQDFLICIEMSFVAAAHLHTFSYKPFTPEGQYALFRSSENELDEPLSMTRSSSRSSEGDGSVDPNKGTHIKKEDQQRRRMHRLRAQSTDRGRESNINKDPNVRSVGQTSNYTPPGGAMNNHSQFQNFSDTFSIADGELASDVNANTDESSFANTDPTNSSHAGATSKLKMPRPKFRSSTESRSSQSIRQSQKSNSNGYEHTMEHEAARFNVESQQVSCAIEQHSDNSQINRTRAKYALAKAGSTVKAASNSVGEMLNRHFAASSAVRDFNETMPVVVLPSNFKPQKGIVVHSDPSARLRALDRDDHM